MDSIEQALRIKQNEYETLQVELANRNAENLAIQAHVEKLLAAIGWLEGWFYANIDGGGNHGCPWCYGHEDQKAWCDIKHSEDCVLGKALSSQPDLTLIEEVREFVWLVHNVMPSLESKKLLTRLNPRK